MIIPSIGRVVWYYPPDAEPDQQPWPALICYVHSDRRINLGGFKADGTPYDLCNVYLMQEEDIVKPSEGYACWMPYQQKVAAEAQAKAASVLVPLKPLS